MFIKMQAGKNWLLMYHLVPCFVTTALVPIQQMDFGMKIRTLAKA